MVIEGSGIRSAVLHVLSSRRRLKRHFETNHEKTFKDNVDKAEAIKEAEHSYEKQSNLFMNLNASKNNAIKASYKLALCIGKHGKPFTNRDS